jgi:2-polyprenyl-6-methoxyphenol hydroxylase-like FAD-dependent oxidoreductase
MSGSIDVLIVGAGPSGLLLAIDLAHRGVRVRIIDIRSGPDIKTKATLVHARTLELMPAPVVDAVLRSSSLITQFCIFEHDGALRKVGDFDFEPRAESRDTYGMHSLEQWRMEAILTSHLHSLLDASAIGSECTPGSKPCTMSVQRNTKLVSLSESRFGVSAQLERAGGRIETINARWLIGADGAHSSVRRLLGLPLPGKTAEDNFFAMHASFEGMAPQLVPDGRSGYFVFSRATADPLSVR